MDRNIESLEEGQKIEPFYTGGDIAVARGQIFTPCGAQVKATSLLDGNQQKNYGGEDESEVTCLTVTPDEKSLIVAYRNALLRRFDLESGELKRTWKSLHRAPALSLLAPPSPQNDLFSTTLISGGADYAVKVWDIRQETCTHSFTGCSSIISSLALDWGSGGGGRVYAGSGEGEVRRWDLNRKTGGVVVQSAEGTAVVALLISAPLILVACRSGRVAGFYLKDSGRAFSTETGGSIHAMRVRPLHDDTYLVSSDEGLLSLWNFNISSHNRVWTSEKKSEGGSGLEDVLQIVPSGEEDLVLASADHNIAILNKSLSMKRQMVGNNDEILSISYAGDSHVVVGTNSPALRVYSLEDGASSLLSGHSEAVLSVDVATWDSRVFISASKDNTICLWRMTHSDMGASIRRVGKGTGHTNNVVQVKFSKQASNFFASVSTDTTIKLWPLPKELVEETELSDESVKLSASATVVAHDKDITCLDISPNDKLLASGSMDKSVKIWRVKGKKDLILQGTIRGHSRGVWDVAFSTSDQVIASASGDCSIKIFALSDLSCVKTLEGHESAVLNVRFISNGLQLVSTDSGGLLKLWSIKKSQCLKTYESHDDKIWALAVHKDGKNIATGSADSKIILWQDRSEENRTAAAEKSAEESGQEQTLANLLQSRQLTDAFKLAISLGRFHKLQIIVAQLQEEGSDRLKSTLKLLSDEETGVLLQCICDWNTNSRNSEMAHRTLKALLEIRSPASFLKLPNCKTSIEGLLAYSQRHYDRLSTLQQQSRFIGYTWQCSRLA